MHLGMPCCHGFLCPHRLGMFDSIGIKKAILLRGLE